MKLTIRVQLVGHKIKKVRETVSKACPDRSAMCDFHSLKIVSQSQLSNLGS